MAGITFQPFEPTVGAGGAVTGLAAVHLVELVQVWTLLPKPRISLLKLTALLAVTLVAGILPQVN